MTSTAKFHHSFWKVNPIARPTIVFVLGVLFGFNYSPEFFDLFFLSIFLQLFLGVLLFFFKFDAFSSFSDLRAIILLLLCCSLGYLSSSLSIPDKQAFYSGNSIHNIYSTYKFKIISEPVVGEHSKCKFNGRLEAFSRNNTWYPASGKYKCYINLNDSTLIPSISSTIYLKGYPSLPEFCLPNNEFDFRSWLISNNFEGVFNANNYQQIENDFNFSLQQIASKFRSDVLYKFTSHNSLVQEGELAGALLLGDRKGIDPSLNQSFIEIGIIHLLAVSGLHVGLVFQIISFILAFCIRNKKLNSAIVILSLFSLWSYSLITGLSASVCRAACMLSLVVIGKGIKRKIPTFNLLIGSAFLLIIIDPSIIYDIGFQLSFSAVFGIFSINSILKRIKLIQSKFIQLILVSSSISVAAQIATLPLTLYYFGRFPVYFLIANLIAIPLASIISYVGFVALVLQSIPYIGNAFIWITLMGIKCLISFSHLISKLPSPSIIFQTFELSFCLILAYIIVLFLLNSNFSKSFAIKSCLSLIILNSLWMMPINKIQSNASIIVNQPQKNELRISLIKSKNNFQSIFLSQNGISLKPFSVNSNQIESKWAFGNDEFSIVLTNNELFPVVRPKSKFVLLIIGSIKQENLKLWVDRIRPDLVLITPWVYRKQKQVLEKFVAYSGLHLWNYHSINKLVIMSRLID